MNGLRMWAVAVLLVLSAGARAQDLKSVGWLTGGWKSVDATGLVTEEYWSNSSSDMMVGMSHSIRDGKTRAFEFLRIEAREGAIVYVASPNAKKTAEFKLVSPAGDTFAFEGGDEHVQRVIYRRTGPNSMVARVEGTFDGKAFAQEYSYNRTQ